MQPRILIVDDEKENIDALKRLLRKEFSVLSALSGEEGLEVFQKEDPEGIDVVVSDQRMPGMQGSEFLEQISKIEPLATRILLTGFSDIEAVVEAVNRGQIWRYVAKPWEPEDFILTVRQAAERSRLQKSLSQSRLELQRALNELRAKDWARGRLLNILLHEFRTAPQILEAIKELDPGGEAADTRLKFISNLGKRFQDMAQDIEGLLADEKKLSLLPKEILSIKEIFSDISKKDSAKNSIDVKYLGTENSKPTLLAHRETIQLAFEHFCTLLQANTTKSALSVQIDWDETVDADLFISFQVPIEDLKNIPLPQGLVGDKNIPQDPILAWSILLEPFVGADNFAHHSSGLRVETSKHVRSLTTFGAKLAFQMTKEEKSIELLVVFKIQSFL